MRRRQFLKNAMLGGAGLATGASGGAIWLSGAPSGIAGFPDVNTALGWLDTLADNGSAHSLTQWPLAHVLEHSAQSVGFSLHGFPQAKPAWFQETIGALAFAAFNRRGAMRHGLTEPIPGAPALTSTSVPLAAERLGAMLREFLAHRGPLAPHFAYGALDKAQFTRAHLMHLANHAEKIALA